MHEAITREPALGFGRNLMFQQENGPKPDAKTAQEVNVLHWPSQRPDPAEIWAEICGNV